MPRIRLPMTVEDALARAIADVGIDRLALWTGKSESWLRACADPDRDTHRLHVESALAIDRGLVENGCEPPFAELFAASADRARPQVKAGPTPLQALLAVGREFGELAGVFERAHADGTLSPAERSRICAEARQVVTAARTVLRTCMHEPAPLATGKTKARP